MGESADPDIVNPLRDNLDGWKLRDWEGIGCGLFDEVPTPREEPTRRTPPFQDSSETRSGGGALSPKMPMRVGPSG